MSVPPATQEDGYHDPAVGWTWSFYLIGLPGGRTRLHVRVRGRAAPRWLAVMYIAVIIPADFVIAAGMLRGLTWCRWRSPLAGSGSGRRDWFHGREATRGYSAVGGSAALVPGQTVKQPVMTGGQW